MPDNKNQHYVPKTYLRKFSADENLSSVHVYLVNHDKAVKFASIRGQCSKDNFYGEDRKLDQALQAFEKNYSTYVSRLTKFGSRLNDDDLFFARYFMLLQSHRTAKSIDRTFQMMRQMAEFYRATEIAHGNEWDEKNNPSFAHAIAESLLAFREMMADRVVDDLKLLVLHNTTDLDFVTSDDPVVMTNRWLLQRKKISNFGLNSAGLIFAMPVSSRHALMAYDPDVYSVVISKKFHTTIGRRADILALNQMQYLRADSCIYFSDYSKLDGIKKEFKRFNQNRKEPWGRFTAAKLESESKGSKEYAVGALQDVANSDDILFHSETNWPSPPTWPSILRYKNRPRSYSRGRLIVRKKHRDADDRPTVNYRTKV